MQKKYKCPWCGSDEMVYGENRVRIMIEKIATL